MKHLALAVSQPRQQLGVVAQHRGVLDRWGDVPELAREGVPLTIIQRQLGHVNLGTTSIYPQGIDPEEIIIAVGTRRAPMTSPSAGLKL
jgi:hypothetical protein